MDTETIINEAQKPDTFDVLAFVEATAYPTEEVVVFQDAKSADEYVKLVNKRIELDKENELDSSEEVERLTLEIQALGDKIRASTLIFELRGMPPGVVAEILEVPKDEPEEDNEKNDLAREETLIARTIVGVRNHKGDRDVRVFDGEAVSKLRKFLKEKEFGKLIKGVSNVNFNAAVFDQATDAGFLGGSADVA